MSKKFEEISYEEMMNLVKITHQSYKEKEKKSSKGFYLLGGVMGGLALGAGNIPSFLVINGIVGTVGVLGKLLKK